MLNNYHYLSAWWNDKDLGCSWCPPGYTSSSAAFLQGSARFVITRNRFLSLSAHGMVNYAGLAHELIHIGNFFPDQGNLLTHAHGHWAHTEANCHASPCIEPATVLLLACGFNPQGIRLPHS
jgi:hypothetical protein